MGMILQTELTEWYVKMIKNKNTLISAKSLMKRELQYLSGYLLKKMKNMKNLMILIILGLSLIIGKQTSVRIFIFFV